MKTVSAKLDNKLHNQFTEFCNDEGKCQSEFLRDMIQNLCDDCFDEIKDKESEPEIETDEISMAHGKILDDYGNVIGTF